MQTLYEVLGIPPCSTEDEIKQAFRDLARKLHPDLNPGREEEMVAVNDAYKLLIDPKERRAYRAKLEFTMDKCSKCSGEGVTFMQKGFTVRIQRRCGVCNGRGYNDRR